MAERQAVTADQLRRWVDAAGENVRFDPGPHTYHVGRTEYPSVTTLLDAVGFGDWMRYIDGDQLEYARQRGDAVHLATQYLDEGRLDWASVHDVVRPYVEAYAEWKERSGFEAVAVERPLAHRQLGFAGKADRIGLAGLPTWVDLKSGVADLAHALQLAAYPLLVPQVTLARRIALYLRDDGTFRVKEFPLEDLPRDTAAFKAALTLGRWKLCKQSKKNKTLKSSAPPPES